MLREWIFGVCAIACFSDVARAASTERERSGETEAIGTAVGIEAPIGQAAPSSPVARAPVPPKPTIAQVEAALVVEFSKTDTALKAAGQMNLPPEDLPLMVEHLRALYADPRLTKLIAREIYRHLDEISEATGYAIGRRVAEDTTLRVQWLGFASADDNLIKRMLSFMSTIPRFTTGAECKAVFADSPDAASEFAVVARMGAAAFKDYLAMIRSAISLGLTAPKIVPITPDQKAKATEAFATQLLADAEKMPDAEARMVGEALQDLDKAPAESACKGYAAIFSAAVAMPGQTGEWFRRNYMIEASEDNSARE